MELIIIHLYKPQNPKTPKRRKINFLTNRFINKITLIYIFINNGAYKEESILCRGVGRASTARQVDGRLHELKPLQC